MKTFKKLLFLLTLNERKKAGLLLFMILIMAILDTIGVASILPFMAVLTNPVLIETNIFLNTMFKASGIFGVKSNDEFLFALGIFVFIILLISLTFKAFTAYAQARFVQMREYSIGKRLVEGYLQQPYSWFLSRNSAELGKTILSEVSQVIGSGIRPLMELIAQSVLVTAIITLLLITNPILTLIVAISLGGTYAIFYLFFRSFLKKIGAERLKSNELRFMAISEAFGAAKEVKMGGLEEAYTKRFTGSAKNFALAQTYSTVIASIPRFILEAIAFGGVILIILYLMSQSGSFGGAVPIISLYVFAGYRLMPALQKIYASITLLTFVSATLEKLTNDFQNLNPIAEKNDSEALPLNKNIELKKIQFNYPNSSRTALEDISLLIPSKSSVGLIGATGSGKTTTVDIILGLLEPQKGTLKIDDNIITKENLRSWQKSIGYVPQQIFLSDDTIAANIAFGVRPKDIKFDAVEKAAKIANLHQFIMDDLPKQYQTVIGERGIRLSGGQRQRIGIARALYNDPQALILDEATNALDNLTEDAVMDAINSLSKNITIIIIAHRLKTVKNCDIIFKFEKGRLVSQGSYDKVIGNSK